MILSQLQNPIETFIILLFYAIIIIPIVIGVKNRKERNKEEKKANEAIEPITPIIPPVSIEPENNNETAYDYKNSYEARYLLTKNEWYQYHTLKKIADQKGYIICPKVRLLDIIQPRRGTQNYKTLLYKIQSKHIDFVICDKTLRIKAVLELDDNSHDQTDRKERDTFVNEILTSVGYKVIHTRAVTENTLDCLGTPLAKESTIKEEMTNDQKTVPVDEVLKLIDKTADRNEISHRAANELCIDILKLTERNKDKSPN